MASYDEQQVLDLGTNPIPGGDPCGSDVADDEQYIEVNAQISGLDRIESEEPDWYMIEQSTINILSSKSKDVEMAAALGHALFKQHSYAGLAATLGLFTELVKNFWDNLYPARPRRRKARMEMLTDRFSEHGWFRDNQPKPDEFDAVDLCLVRIDEFTAALSEKMPDDPPDVKKFVRGLKELAARRPKPQEAAPAAPAAAPVAGAAPAAAGGATFAAGDVADKSGALNAISGASTFLRKADATDAIPYAITRIMKWSSMSLPTSDEAKTQIPPPEKTAVEALVHQHANGMWEFLLNNAESAFRSQDPLWLDLQRYTCSAMVGLGAPYDIARETIMSLTGALVKRLGNGLYDLTFRGGMPLCSGETRMWLESEVVASQEGGGGGGGTAGNGQLDEATAKARKLAGAGKLKEGLRELQEGLATCTQRRDRFMWRLRIAQLCFEAKKLQLSASLLEDCAAEIRRYHIDEWEPVLAVDVAQTLYKCRKTLTLADKAPAQEALQSVRDSFAWLCQLDPLAALAAEPSGQ